jgi:hypothetical protein
MTVEGGNVVNSDGDGSECREPYYALPLWKEYLAAKARWEDAHREYCKVPTTGPQSAMKAQRRQELLEIDAKRDHLLTMLRSMPEHLKAFGW